MSTKPDPHTLLANSTVKQLNCPHCGGNLMTTKRLLKRSWLRRLLRLPHRKRRCQHCGKCGRYYTKG